MPTSAAAVRAHGWVDVGRRLPQAGLPGRVQLAPSVWLCCVYLSSQHAERVSAEREASRLEALLDAAADAWLRQDRAVTSNGRSCVFCFRPENPATADHPVHKHSPGFLIRIQVSTGDAGETLTRLEFAG